MTLRHNTRLWLLPLLAAWIFDLLFWDQNPGISIPIWFALVLAIGIFLLAGEGKRLARTAWPLAAAALFFSFMVAVRAEPFSSFMNIAFAVGALSILALTALGGQWLRYSLTDYVLGWLRLGWSAATKPLQLVAQQRTERAEDASAPTNQATWLAPLLRGLLMALPVVALLAALLASADTIFSARLKELLDALRIENLAEYIYRGIYILLIAYLFIGTMLHARFHSEEEKLTGQDKPWLAPFIGWIEASVILACVNLLFLTFVIIQFRYFFGGQVNIHLDGFTYSEYARRGFGELVFVAMISLVLFLGLSGVTRREGSQQRSIFTGLGITLVLLVLVMLVSAFQRLQLYEAAYGFSRLRTYTHVFVIWLAVLLVATVGLEIAQRPRAFALALVSVAVGFVLTINLINVDGFIARQNTGLAVQTGSFSKESRSMDNELDSSYLGTLSADAIPTLVELFEDQSLSDDVRDRLGAVLACQSDRLSTRRSRTWTMFHFSDYWAGQALNRVQPKLAAYPISLDENDFRQVSIQGEVHLCDQPRMD